MTVLAREPDLYPSSLLEMFDPDSDRTWWALYCRSNQEKTLMRRLRTLEVPFYSPLVPHRSRSRVGRVRTAYIPLFSGYVFIHGTDEHRYTALTTSCVSRWLPVPDPEELTADLRRIHTLIEAGVPLTIESRLTPGMRVRLKSGSMMGMEGTVLRRQNSSRLLIAVNFLQQGASFDVEDWQLEPIL